MCLARLCARLWSCDEAQAQSTALSASGVRAPAGSSGRASAAKRRPDKAQKGSTGGHARRSYARCARATQRYQPAATKGRCVELVRRAQPLRSKTRVAGNATHARALRVSGPSARDAMPCITAAPLRRSGRPCSFIDERGSLAVWKRRKREPAADARPPRSAMPLRHAPLVFNVVPLGKGGWELARAYGTAAAPRARAPAENDDASRHVDSRLALPRPWQPLRRCELRAWCAGAAAGRCVWLPGLGVNVPRMEAPRVRRVRVREAPPAESWLGRVLLAALAGVSVSVFLHTLSAALQPAPAPLKPRRSARLKRRKARDPRASGCRMRRRRDGTRSKRRTRRLDAIRQNENAVRRRGTARVGAAP